MSRASALLALLRGVQSPEELRIEMLLRALLALHMQARSADDSTPAAEAADTGAMAPQLADSSAANEETRANRAELLQLDAPAILLHIMRVYAEPRLLATADATTAGALAAADKPEEPRFLQVQLACMDVLQLLCLDSSARAVFVPALGAELIAALEHVLTSYATPSLCNEEPLAQMDEQPQREPSITFSVEALHAAISLVNVLLSERGSSALFVRHSALWLRLLAAVQHACRLPLPASLLPALHSSILTLLLLLQHHQLDQFELHSSSSSSLTVTAALQQELLSAGLLNDVLLASIAPTIKETAAHTQDDTGGNNDSSFASRCWNYSAVVAGCCKLAAATHSDAHVCPSSLLRHGRALAGSLFDLLSVALSSPPSSSESSIPAAASAKTAMQTVDALRALCHLSDTAVMEALEPARCDAWVEMIEQQCSKPFLLQSCLRLLHTLLRSSSALSSVSLPPTDTAVSDSASAASSVSESMPSADISCTVRPCRSLASHALLSCLLLVLESSVTAAPLNHLESDAWLDVQASAFYALAALLSQGADLQAQAHGQTTLSSGAMETPAASTSNVIPTRSPCTDEWMGGWASQACRLAMQCLTSLAPLVELAAAPSCAPFSASASSVAAARGALSADSVSLLDSVHRSVCSFLFVLAGIPSLADALLTNGCVAEVLTTMAQALAAAVTAEKTRQTEGEEEEGTGDGTAVSASASASSGRVSFACVRVLDCVVRPCFLFFLRLGGRASPSISVRVFATHAAAATRVCQAIDEYLPQEETQQPKDGGTKEGRQDAQGGGTSLRMLLVDALLMLQGKLPAPALFAR